MEGIYLMCIAVIGMVCIAAMVCVAMYLGLNGTLFGAAVGVIGTIVGYAFGVRKAGE